MENRVPRPLPAETYANYVARTGYRDRPFPLHPEAPDGVKWCPHCGNVVKRLMEKPRKGLAVWRLVEVLRGL